MKKLLIVYYSWSCGYKTCVAQAREGSCGRKTPRTRSYNDVGSGPDDLDAYGRKFTRQRPDYDVMQSACRWRSTTPRR